MVSGFEEWVKMFEKRASLGAWSDEQKLVHMKVHLGKSVLGV